MDEMKNLIEELNQAAEVYYNFDDNIISDYEYDKLYDRLLSLEKKFNIVLPDSPSRKVGFKTDNKFKKIKHAKKMLSLDKTKDINKLKDFLGDKIGLLSWKLDGLTIVLEYENGFLKKIITRGNGEIGEDVTHNFCVFKNLPEKISYKKKLILRGEAVISYKDFNAINFDLTDEEKYKNPRNLASGIIRNLKPKDIFYKKICFFAFDLVDVEENNNDFYDFKDERFNWLKKIGFEVVKYKITDKNKIADDVKNFISEIKKFKFAADGLVLTFNDKKFGDSLGVTQKFPRDSIAFKWADKTIETELLKIEWKTSRTGLINPVAVFKKINLDGSNINKASLHNVSFIKNLELGIGDKIKVYKANMIIPQIADNLTRSNNFEIPKRCPACNFMTEIKKINESEFLFCKNKNCKAKLIMGLAHFVSRDAMNINGLSEMIIKKLVDNNFLSSYLDIYELKKFEQEIKFFGILDAKDPNKNHKLYANLIKKKKKSKHVCLYNFIYALGINNVGLSNAKILCDKFDWDIKKIISADKDDLNNIYGFGNIIAESIYNYFREKKNLDLINQAIKILDFIDGGKKNKNKILAGINFVITGKLKKFKSRKVLIDLIESNGGHVFNNVTQKINYLINNDIESKSKKNLLAKEFGIEIISEQDFLDKFNLS